MHYNTLYYTKNLNVEKTLKTDIEFNKQKRVIIFICLSFFKFKWKTPVDQNKE